MISLSYVNGEHEALLLSDPSLKFESVLESFINEAESMYEAYMEMYSDYMFEADMFGEDKVTDKYKELVTEGTNIFEKIGQQIIKAIESFKKFVSDMISKLKGFDKKSDFDKLQEATKSKDPDVKKAMIDAFNRGDLTVYDAKSVKDIEDAYLELVKLYKDKGCDPTTFKGKCEMFKKKLENADKSGLVSVAKALTAVTAGVVAIPLLKKTMNDIKSSSLKLASDQAKNNEELAATFGIHDGKTDFSDKVSPDNGKTVMMHNIAMLKMGFTEKCITKNDTVYNKIMDGIKKVISIFDKSGNLTGKIDAKVAEHDAKEVAAGKEQAKLFNVINDSKKQATKDTAFDQQKARNAADAEDADTKRGIKVKDQKDTTIAQKEAELEYIKKHENEILDHEEKKAGRQQKGRNDYTITPNHTQIAHDQEIGRIQARDEDDKNHPDRAYRQMKAKADAAEKLKNEREKKNGNNQSPTQNSQKGSSKNGKK